MPKLCKSIPKYRLKVNRGVRLAVVTLGGKDHYLGRFNSKASRDEYDRLIAEWLTGGRSSAVGLTDADDQAGVITVTEILLAFRTHSKVYYRKNGRPTGTADNFKPIMSLVKKLYGRTPAIEFGPKRLKAVRDHSIRQDHSRRYVNDNIKRIVQMFRWAVSEELIPPSVPQALQTVRALEKGRSDARDTPPITVVDEAIVKKTCRHLPPVVADMVRIQQLTSCRPGEVCILRPSDVDTGGEVWLYRPSEFKTEHHDKHRVVCIGPQAQALLRPYLANRDPYFYCFSPRESEEKRLEIRENSRRTPSGYGNRQGSNKKHKPKRTAGNCYTNDSFRRAIHRACEKAGVSQWSPNQLRHSAATKLRSSFGIEATSTVLGHSKLSTTEIYAERDLQTAIEVMKEIG